MLGAYTTTELNKCKVYLEHLRYIGITQVSTNVDELYDQVTQEIVVREANYKRDGKHDR